MVRPFSRRIASRLIIAIILFSSLVTLISTAVQLWVEYQRDLEMIHLDISEVSESHLPAIAHTLWTYDEAQIKILLTGLTQIGDIEYLEVSGNDGGFWRAGNRQSQWHILQQLPLTHSFLNESYHLGHLTFYAITR